MTTPLSVAYINNFPGPTLGGGEVQLISLMRGVRDAGIDVTLVCARGSALERAAADMDRVRVVPIDFVGMSLSALAGQIQPEIGEATIVQGTGFLTNVLARKVGPSLGARVVNVVHVMPGAAQLDGESAIRGLVRRTLDATSRRSVDVFVAVSSAVGDAVAAQGVNREHIVIVPNGIDAKALRDAAAGETAPALKSAQRHVGYVGRLETVKGCEYFLRAAALIQGMRADTAFFVVGAGSLEVELQVMAVQLGVAERVDFLGYVGSVAPLLASADVVVVPSLSEAFGLTAAEALALGSPVVASNVGGLPDVVRDGETGLLVPPANAEAIAEAVSRLLDDLEFARRLGAAGAEHVDAEFTVQGMVQGYLGVYEDLL